MSLSLAITADLHWGHQRGTDANNQLIASLREDPVDVLILAGDVGSGAHFGECLKQFDFLEGRKCLVPGNHDIWVARDNPVDSWVRYQVELPAECERWGFHYLDQNPLLLPEEDLAVVGTMNWYDYSWSLERLRQVAPQEEHRLQSKRFIRGRHNDANFVRWPFGDPEFTELIVNRFEQQLLLALDVVGNVIVVAHHPPLRTLGFPMDPSVDELDVLLWDAFSGNQKIEQILKDHASRISMVFCGHTHRARESYLENTRGFNIGGDYHFKRLIRSTWPDRLCRIEEFFSRKAEPQP